MSPEGYTNKKIPRNWLVTDNPFIIPYTTYTAGQLTHLDNVLVGVKPTGKLGITQAQIDVWVQNQTPILEVGPGYGVSFLEMKNLGLNICAIEPTLATDMSNNHTLARDMSVYDEYINSSVFPYLAKDAPTYLADRFDYILAIGTNFQNYSQGPVELFENIMALLKCIKPDSQGYLAFEVSLGGTVQLVGKVFNLSLVLDNFGIRYEVVTTFNGDTLDSHLIRIYRPDLNDTNLVEISLQLIESIDSYCTDSL